MHIFIDEGGTFVPWTGWGVVCSLAIPHKQVGPARRDIRWLTRSWPRKDGELKGGLLDEAQLGALVDLLFRHDALMHAYAIDVSQEDQSAIERHKRGQCEGITKYLAPTHHPNFVRQVWDLRHLLERMPYQLYLQSILMTELVRRAAEESTMYFAQRRPRELANFEWTIDAKDPQRITTYEKWWRDTLAPLLDSRARSEPFPLVRDPAFNYYHFDRKFLTEHDMWYPDRPREIVEAYDIKKMITEKMRFVDSRLEVLIQAVDILASFLRRLLAKEVSGPGIARALGRLQVMRRHDKGTLQSLGVLTVSRKSSTRTGLFETVRAMTAASRSMMKPSLSSAA
jgi:Protein of unknown function (DUF3800)